MELVDGGVEESGSLGAGGHTTAHEELGHGGIASAFGSYLLDKLTLLSGQWLIIPIVCHDQSQN